MSTPSLWSTRASSLLDGVLEASVVGSFTRIGPVVRSRLDHWTPFPATPGRVVVVTGATSGLGREAAIELGGLGCTVVAVGRNAQRLDEVGLAITDAGGTAFTHQADLTDLNETAALASAIDDQLDHIDVLMHNAGALLATRELSPQGHEVTVSVHLLSPYLLTTALRPNLDRAARAKVLTMTSGGMYTEPFDLATLEMDATSYKGSVAYARAKRSQVVLNDAWARAEPPDGITFAAVHPGWAKTPGVSGSLPTFDKVLGPLLRTPAEGVDTMVWLATQPPGEPTSGQLWLDRRPRSIYKLKKTRVGDAELHAQGAQLVAWLDAQIADFR